MKPANPVYRIVLVRTAQASVFALLIYGLLHWPLTGPHALGLFLTPLLCLYFLFVFVAPWSWGLPILTRLPTREKVAALTFDDGPSPQTTALVLDSLGEYGVTATFFVLGEAVERNPELLQRIFAEGHTVGVHGYLHRPFVLRRGKELVAEIQQTRDAILRACPEAALSRWLRPPYGFKSLRALWAAQRANCRLVAWNVDGRDYREVDPQRITKNVLDRLRPGAIILLHDGPDNGATILALPLILRQARARGYRFVLLPPPELARGTAP